MLLMKDQPSKLALKMNQKFDIILVDDDDVYLFVATHIFKSLSRELSIESFTDGEQALTFFKECAQFQYDTPDVLLLDINMPFLDGWSFLNEYEKLKPGLKSKVHIYLVTSSNRERDRQRANQYKDLESYIVKPVSRSKLKKVLADVYNYL